MDQKTLVRLFVVTLTLFGAGIEVGRAQQACSEFMKFGIYDEFDTLSNKKDFELFQKWLCSHQFSSFAQAEQEATNAGFGAEIFSFNFGNTTARNSWSQWQSQMCVANFSVISRDATYVTRVRQISPALMAVLKACLEGNTPGFRAWISTSRDRTQVSLTARYVPVVNETARVRTFAVTPRRVLQNCQPLSELAHDAIVDNGGSSITCQVNPRSTLTFTVNTSGGRAAIILDPYEPPPNAPAPTATISATPRQIIRGNPTSLVWTSQFASEVDITNIGNGVPLVASILLVPAQTTTYAITAKALSGATATASVSVEVTEPPPTIEAWTSSNSIVRGQTAVLSWSSSNGTVSIDQGIGDVPPTGTRNVNPQSTTKYTLTVTNAGGTKTDRKTLDVEVTPKIRVWKDARFSGDKIERDGPGAIRFGDLAAASSIEIFTDEWVTFKSSVRFIGNEARPVSLIVKGPKRLDNLTRFELGPVLTLNDLLDTIVVLLPANGPSPAAGSADFIIP